jgi:hypothetical protein
MKQKTLKNHTLSSILKRAKKDNILPFTETPSEERTSPGRDKNPVDAVSLFSLFTADIIKEEVIFTR